MSLFFPNIIIIIISTIYAILLKRKLVETFFLTIVTVIGVLYCFGLINKQGCLLYGIIFLVILSVVGISFLIYTFIKHRQNFHNLELLKGILLYFCFFMLSIFINYGRIFINTDDFSHWGRIIKHFYYFDALGTLENPKYEILAKTYFPGITLFQYFYLRFSNKFIEYYSYISMNIIYLSLFIPFINKIFIKKYCIKQIILTVVFILIPLIISNSFYFELQVDIILGIFFGFSLLYYFIFNFEDSLYGIMMISSSIFMLTITKDIGSLLAIIVIVIIITDLLFFKWINIKTILQKKSIINKIKTIILFIFPFLSFLFVKLSWSIILKINIIKSSFHFPLINEIFIKFFYGPLEQYQIETRSNFKLALFNRKIPYLNVSVVNFSIIITIIILILISFINNNKNKIRLLISTFLLNLGYWGYQFILVLLYTFSFSEYEAPRLASYERYTITYIIGMILFLLVFHFLKQNELIETNVIKLKNKELFMLGKYLYLLTIIILFISLINITKNRIFNINKFIYRIKHFEYSSPRPTAIASENWKTYFEKDNPYFINQGHSGHWFYAMQYDLIPFSKLVNINWDYSISTKPYYEVDPWTFIITPEEWEKYVLTNRFKLLYIYNADKNFKDTYGHFFESEILNDMCYYILNIEGNLKFISVLK